MHGKENLDNCIIHSHRVHFPGKRILNLIFIAGIRMNDIPADVLFRTFLRFADFNRCTDRGFFYLCFFLASLSGICSLLSSYSMNQNFGELHEYEVHYDNQKRHKNDRYENCNGVTHHLMFCRPDDFSHFHFCFTEKRVQALLFSSATSLLVGCLRFAILTPSF